MKAREINLAWRTRKIRLDGTALGDRIARAIRESESIDSAEDLADRIDLDGGTVNDIISGEIATPSMDTLGKMARALGSVNLPELEDLLVDEKLETQREGKG